MRHNNRKIQDQKSCRSILRLIRGLPIDEIDKREILINYMKEVNMQKNLEQYEDLNNSQFLAIFEFGLTREQVLSHNFGYHTSRAIEREMEAGCSSQESFEKYKNLNNIQVYAMTKFGLTRERVLSDNFGVHTLGLLIAHNAILSQLKQSPAETRGRQSEKKIEEVINELINNYSQDKGEMLKHIQSQFIKYDDKGNFSSFNTANIERFCQENKASPHIIKYLTEKVAQVVHFVDCEKIDPQYEGESIYFAGKLVKNYKSALVESASAEQVQGKNSRCVIS